MPRNHMISVRLNEQEWKLYHNLLSQCKCYRRGASATFRALLAHLNAGLAEVLHKEYLEALKREEQLSQPDPDEEEPLSEAEQIGYELPDQIIERFP